MEGKEVRFGIANSALFATATTDASCGAVNSMHDSYTPLGGMVPLVNIMLGEVIFGGVGSGLYGILVFVILAVFIAGLMVGRTPEYLGKKIEAFDVKMAMLSVLISSLTILVFAAIAVVAKFGTSSISNPGPHGLSQILYAYTSATGNNGSAFGGLNANTTLVQHKPRRCHAPGKIFCGDSDSGYRGKSCAKKSEPGISGHFPCNRATLHRSARFHDLDRRRAHFLPGFKSWPHPGASADAFRKGFLRTSLLRKSWTAHPK